MVTSPVKILAVADVDESLRATNCFVSHLLLLLSYTRHISCLLKMQSNQNQLESDIPHGT